jgi:hypothetical protein
MSAMQIGEHRVFRDRPKALGEPVHRVEVVRLDGPRCQGTVHDDPKATENLDTDAGSGAMARRPAS